MRILTASLVTCLILGTGCGPDRSDAAETPFVLVADVPQVMLSILEPAAEVYWDAVGWIIDAEGEHEILPQGDEGWEAVRNAAYVVAESGNLLLMEGRRRDGPWTAFSQAMIEVSERAIRAAEARDRDAVFELGGELYHSCTACHAGYAAETLRPSTQRQ